MSLNNAFDTFAQMSLNKMRTVKAKIRGRYIQSCTFVRDVKSNVARKAWLSNIMIPRMVSLAFLIYCFLSIHRILSICCVHPLQWHITIFIYRTNCFDGNSRKENSSELALSRSGFKSKKNIQKRSPCLVGSTVFLILMLCGRARYTFSTFLWRSCYKIRLSEHAQWI